MYPSRRGWVGGVGQSPLPPTGFTCLKLLPRQPWQGWAGVILLIAVSRRPQPVHLKNRFVPCVDPGTAARRVQSLQSKPWPQHTPALTDCRGQGGGGIKARQAKCRTKESLWRH